MVGLSVAFGATQQHGATNDRHDDRRVDDCEQQRCVLVWDDCAPTHDERVTQAVVGVEKGMYADSLLGQ